MTARTKGERSGPADPTGSRDDELAPADWPKVYSAKLRAELAAADLLSPEAAAIAVSGDPESGVMVVKGVAGEGETAEKRVLSGPDAEALSKALVALDLGESWFATFSRGEDGERPASGVERLALQIEAMEPAVVIALDGPAAQDVAAALGLSTLRFGKPEAVKGRRILAVEGLEASLGDEKAKRRLWSQLRSLKR